MRLFAGRCRGRLHCRVGIATPFVRRTQASDGQCQMAVIPDWAIKNDLTPKKEKKERQQCQIKVTLNSSIGFEWERISNESLQAKLSGSLSYLRKPCYYRASSVKESSTGHKEGFTPLGTSVLGSGLVHPDEPALRTNLSGAIGSGGQIDY